jgi:ribonucleotide reductase alpha subunit
MDPSEMVSMDPSRDSIFSEQALKLLKDYYMHSNEGSPQESFRRAALVYCNGDYAFAQRIYEYVSKGWFMFASPVLSNAPEFGCEEWKGLPISCFLTYVPDDLHGLIDHSSELRWLSVKGGGVGGHWSDVRAVSSKAPGPMPFLQTVDADMTAYRQGTTRKGSYAAYMDVSHPDIVEFVNFRVPTGGDSMRKCFNLHNAVNITDAFMHAVYEDLQWDLIDPHDKSIRETVSARNMWEKIIETRFRTGEPYLNFIDEANRHLPETQKQMGLKIHGSNLCFRGDTLVFLGSGESVSIKELADSGKEFQVWSARKSESSWIPEVKKAIAAKTGTQELIRVLLSDGSDIHCTENHRLAMDNGEYVEAKDSIGCSLYCLQNTAKVHVVGIFRQGTVEDVFDLHVEDNHNFFITTDKRLERCVLVHNCNEIHLATDKDRTAVCCLSSVNLEYFDEWKTTNMIQDCIRLLDNVLQKFIDNCPDDLHKARYSAMQERSLGLGAMGFHSYLQRKGIPFCSGIASSINRKIFSYIKKEAEAASCKLASLYGEAPDMVGTGRRNAHLLSVAPNANSATLLGCSPSIEPWKSNAFTHRTRAGSHLIKNKYLQDLLVSKEKNTDDVWQSIILQQGSIQHLDFLTPDEKDVFKTAFELDQHWIVEHAAVRQQFICQGQSVNLFFPHGSDRSYVNSVHIAAWKKHLKGLYYLRSSSGKVADKVSEPIHIRRKATRSEEVV